MHLSLHADDNANSPPLGILPLYAKDHSHGEFIFDNEWAEAALDNGISYFPKLLSHIPFTPVTTRKLLLSPTAGVKEEEAQSHVLAFLRDLAREDNYGSVHLLFTDEGESEGLGGGEFHLRKSLQWHFKNEVGGEGGGGRKYTNFDHYLANFKSKRRISIRSERRKVRENYGIRIDSIEGKLIREIPGIAAVMFRLYEHTVDKMTPLGRLYLNKRFFDALIDSAFCDNVVLIVARKEGNCDSSTIRAEDIIAGTFNVIGNKGEFFGRYWGSFLDDVPFLHFDVCYYSAIEYVIEKGLEKMEPGAGGGEFKFIRGFNPASVSSSHFIVHPELRKTVSEIIAGEAEGISAVQESAKSALKKR